ncbi:MAG: replication initiation protein [Magnetospirillum sp.]|nr:replication initiation protein [Magnetospirillum sp.]
MPEIAGWVKGDSFPVLETGEAGEIAEIRFRDGGMPSLAARRTLSLLVGKVAGEPWKAGTHRITKRALRQSQEGDDPVGDWLDEVADIRLTLSTVSGRGKTAVERAGLFSQLAEEKDDDDAAWVEFQFHPAARRIFGGANLYARLNQASLLAFEHRYSLTLYELGARLVERRRGTWRGSLADFQARLGVEPDRYGTWAALRQAVLDGAKEEIDRQAHFTVTWKEKRRGRKVTGIELRFWPADRRRSRDGVAPTIMVRQFRSAPESIPAVAGFKGFGLRADTGGVASDRRIIPLAPELTEDVLGYRPGEMVAPAGEREAAAVAAAVTI